MTAQGWPENGELQQALLEAGYSIDAGELEHGIYGLTTKAAVQAFQQAHQLRQDGLAGPETWRALTSGGADSRYTVAGWRCEPSSARPGLVDVLRVAVGEIGVHEEPDGSNAGPRVELYTAPQRGIPWCAAFVSWCYRASEPPAPFGRIFSAVGILDWGRAHGRLVEAGAALQPGDVWIIARADGHGHTGLVAADLGGGQLATIEGNARNAVRGLVRARAALTGFVRPIA